MKNTTLTSLVLFTAILTNVELTFGGYIDCVYRTHTNIKSRVTIEYNDQTQDVTGVLVRFTNPELFTGNHDLAISPSDVRDFRLIPDAQGRLKFSFELATPSEWTKLNIYYDGTNYAKIVSPAGLRIQTKSRQKARAMVRDFSEALWAYFLANGDILEQINPDGSPRLQSRVLDGEAEWKQILHNKIHSDHFICAQI